MKSTLRTFALRGVAALHRARQEAETPRRDTLSILVIRPDHLGDILFLTPALRQLRRALPTATITTLVGGWAEPLLEMNPDVNHVETVPFPWFDRRPKANAIAPYKLLYETAAKLRGRFDVALIARFDHEWGAWLARAAEIPTIIGYDIAGVAPFLTHSVPYTPNRHEVRQNLTLVDKLTSVVNGTPLASDPLPSMTDHPLRYEITGVHRMKARQLLNGSGLQKVDGPLVAIHPGSGAAVKQWQVEKWGELLQALRAEYGCQFVVTGSAAEILLASKVVRATGDDVPIVSVADETTLPELAALFEQCAAVIGPDSGPLHVAVAMGRPTVHLYGPVSPQMFGPWGDPARHRVVTQSLACQYCNRLDWQKEELKEHPCTSGISVRQVLDTFAELGLPQKSTAL